MTEPKFICNGMLGKLCKLMRICGINTAYSNKGKELLIQARNQGRIILTRNTRLKEKKEVFFIETSRPVDQLTLVLDTYKLRRSLSPFSRCIECNHKLEPVAKENIREKIPYYTYQHFNEFAWCPSCQRVFWKGSHYKHMIKDIADILTSTKRS
jgi:uncharacterized protein with PIN domain